MYQTNLFANSFRVIGWTKLFIWEMQPGNRLQKTLHGHVQRCFEVRNVQLASWSALWGDPKWTANQPPETVKGEKKTAKFLVKKETNWLYRSVSKKWCGWTWNYSEDVWVFISLAGSWGGKLPSWKLQWHWRITTLNGRYMFKWLFFPLSLASFAGVYLSGWRYIHVWDRESWYLNLYFAAVTGG